jgi:hypothetical protein
LINAREDGLGTEKNIILSVDHNCEERPWSGVETNRRITYIGDVDVIID